MSKFTLNVLEKRVYPFTVARDADVILGATFGEDVALTQVGDEILVSHVDPIVGAIGDIGWLAVHVACNDIATSGVRPRWALLLVLVPKKEDEELLEQIMRQADHAAREIDVSIIGGHSGYSSGITRPLVAVTALGTTKQSNTIRTQGAGVGDHVFVTKGAGLEGTAILAQDFAGTAKKLGLSKVDLVEARKLMKVVSVIPEALALAEEGVTAMHDVTRGGVIETLLEVAYLSNVGIEIDASQVPVPPIVSRFARAFKFDPLKMISSGSLVATVPKDSVEKASQTLKKAGVPFADAGRVVDGRGVRVIHKDRVAHYKDIHCEDDELARLWAINIPDKR